MNYDKHIRRVLRMRKSFSNNDLSVNDLVESFNWLNESESSLVHFSSILFINSGLYSIVLDEFSIALDDAIHHINIKFSLDPLSKCPYISK